jgi:hypothetical protein
VRAHEKHFSDATMAYIETDQTDGPSVTRTEYEHLRELMRKLRVQGDQSDVALSLPMFERMLEVIAVGLLRESRE